MKAFILGLAVLSFVGIGTATENEKLHEEMTVEEVRQLFNTEPLEVPDYNVVPIQWPRIHKRSHGSKTRLHVKAFGHDVKLWLNPLNGVLFTKDTPIYVAQSTNDANSTVKFTKISDAMAEIGNMFEDREKHASLVVKRSASGSNLISGHIGSEGLTIKPLPERFRRRFNTDPETEHHIIYRNPELSDNADYLTQPIKDDILNNKALRSKREAPDVIYPQILVMVDYENFKLHGEHIHNLLEYMVPFWNGVDLRYRALESPKVRLNIAGIVVARDANAFPFVADNKPAPALLNIFEAIYSLSLFMPTVTSYFPVDSYDIAVLIAPYRMCHKNDEGVCEPGYLGLAYIGGACDVNLTIETPQILSVAVVTDKGAYDGMHVASHELGHLFSSNHDGEGSNLLCDPKDGNIMTSSPVLTKNTSDWSRCSLDAFDNFFNTQDPKCLFNKPKMTSPLPRILPGKYMSADEQCAKQVGTKACKIDENICVGLRCVWEGHEDSCHKAHDSAADGTTCGDGKICIHAQCWAEEDIV